MDRPPAKGDALDVGVLLEERVHAEEVPEADVPQPEELARDPPAAHVEDRIVERAQAGPPDHGPRRADVRRIGRGAPTQQPLLDAPGPEEGLPVAGPVRPAAEPATLGSDRWWGTVVVRRGVVPAEVVGDPFDAQETACRAAQVSEPFA